MAYWCSRAPASLYARRGAKFWEWFLRSAGRGCVLERSGTGASRRAAPRALAGAWGAGSRCFACGRAGGEKQETTLASGKLFAGTDENQVDILKLELRSCAALNVSIWVQQSAQPVFGSGIEVVVSKSVRPISAVQSGDPTAPPGRDPTWSRFVS